MQTETKRYKGSTKQSQNKERQLSSLFNIIGSNLLVVSEVLNNNYQSAFTQKLESISSEAISLAKELIPDNEGNNKDLTDKISNLKKEMLETVSNLNTELNSIDTNNKPIEDIILVRRLLRESQRGLATIQD